MKKGIPLLVAAMMVMVLSLASGLVVDHSVKELPSTTGADDGQSSGSKANGAQATGNGQSANTDSDKAQSSNAKNDDGLWGVVARFFGINSGETVSSGDSGAASEPGRGAGSVDPNYLAMKIFGTNISGLEFSGLFQPNTEQTYSYFKGKSMNTVRIPFDWNEMQPDLYGDFDQTAKEYLDQNIDWAKKHGLSVILDMHNYGQRYIYREGGFRDDFATTDHQHTFQMPYGDQDRSAGTLTFRDFGRGVAGTMTGPVLPASGYRVSLDAKIDSFTGEPWNEFYMDVMYKDENNRYSLVINPVTNTWSLRQTINGAQTTLASGSKNWVVGQYYSFAIDVNQAQQGKINVAVDGVPLVATNSVNSNAVLAHGKISMFPSGVKATIKNFTLNVAGDTTSGGPIERRLTEDGLSLDAWKDFWTKMAAAYKNNPTVLGYDQNEPHDMPVPTSPANYSYAAAAQNAQPIATATAMGQSMVDAIRAVGDTKFVVVEMDHWANTHYFKTQYGSDPVPWITDNLAYSKVVYSGHYYFDADHSGIYAPGSAPGTNAQISADVEPFFQWCQNKKQICYIGEFGVPNTSQWQPALRHFLDLTRQYSIWWTQWAGGDIYSSPTTLQPTSSFTTDTLQMNTIEDFLKN